MTPLKRELHYRMAGKDVKAVQRALHRLADPLYGPAKPTSRFGSKTVKAVKQFQHRHKLQVTGHYDTATHSHLSQNPAWDGYCDWLMKTTVLPDPTTHQRDLVVSAFMYLYHKAPLPYSMGPDRDDFLEGEPVLSNYPYSSDCSGSFEWCYWVRGLPQPSGLGWRVLGYTGSMIEHGKIISRNQLRPGDAMFYGFPVSHVAMYVGGNHVLSRGSPGGPQYYSLTAYRNDLNHMRTYF